MTTSNNGSMPSTGIDKNALYGDYRDHMKKQNRLYMRAAHKALDIPDDDVGINTKTDNSRHGIGAIGATALAAIAGGLPLASLFFAGMFNKPELPPTGPPAVVKPAEPETKTEIKTVTKTKTIDWEVGKPIVE